MGTKIDQKWAQGIRTDVNALVSEVERLEAECDRLETVAGWAQGVLTALNVGDVRKECGLHRKLRAVMIAYREGKSAQEINAAAPPEAP